MLVIVILALLIFLATTVIVSVAVAAKKSLSSAFVALIVVLPTPSIAINPIEETEIELPETRSNVTAPVPLPPVVASCNGDCPNVIVPG